MSLAQHELTNLGVEYLRDAQLGQLFRVFRMAVGNGVVANLPDDLWTLTDLVGPVRMDIPISTAESIDENTIRVTGVLSSLNVPSGQGFRFNELGIFTDDGTGGGEILYSVANVGSDTGDNIPDQDSPAVVVQSIEAIIRIDRVQNIQINIQPAGTYEATNRGLATVGPGPYIEKIGDVLHFRRFVEGPGIEIIGEQDTITISERILEVDLDLYVPTTYVGMPPGSLAFDTIPEALNYLDPIGIPPDRLATIHVDGVTLDHNEPIIVDHKDSENIAIVGRAGTIRNATSPTTAGTAVILNGAVGAFDGIVAGDFIGINTNPTGGGGGPGNNANMASGVWPVASVAADGSSLTYTHGVGIAGSMAGAAFFVYPFTTVLRFAGVGGIAIRGSGIRNLANLVLIGTGSAGAHGVQVNRGDATVNRVGVRLWGGAANPNMAGFLCSGLGYLRLIDCYSCGNGDGAYFPSSGEITRSIFNANFRRGIFLNGANLTAVTIAACQNINAGVSMGGSNIIFSESCFLNNGVGGLFMASSDGQFFGNASYLLGNALGITSDGDITLRHISSLTNAGAPILVQGTHYNTITPSGNPAAPVPGTLAGEFSLFRAG